MVLLEEKKLTEEARAAQNAREEAEVTVRTKYDHEANKLLKRFQALAVRNPYQAMAVYDRLRDGYPGSAALADAYPDAARIAGQLNRKLEVMIAAKEKSLEKEREALRKEEEKRRGNPKLTKEQRQVLMDASRKGRLPSGNVKTSSRKCTGLCARRSRNAGTGGLNLRQVLWKP